MKALLFSFLLISQVHAANLDRIFHSDEMKSFCKKIVTEVAPGRWKSHRPLMVEAKNSIYTSIKEGKSWVVSRIDENHERTILHRSHTPIYDLAHSTGHLWVAERDFVLKLNDRNGKVEVVIPSHRENRSLGKHERLHALYVQNDKLFIAHGTLGVTSLDLLTHQYLGRAPLLTYQDNGHRSKAMTLVGNGEEVFIGFDNTTQPTNRSRAFNGILHTRFDNMKKYHGAAYDHRRVGVLAFAWLTYDQGNIVINNLGNLHIIPAKKVRTKKKIRPRWSPVKVVQDGELVFANLSGKILAQNSTVYGCAEVMLDPAGRAERRGVVVTHQY